MKRLLFVLVAMLALVTVAHAQDAEVTAVIETAPSIGDGAVAPRIWVHPEDVTESRIIGTDDNAGLAVYDLEGSEVQMFDDAPYKNLDLRYNFPLGDELVTLVAANVDVEPMIVFFTVNEDDGTLEELGTLEVGIPTNGTCMYISPLNVTYYVFAISELGEVEQWAIDGSSGELEFELAREFEIGNEAEGCAADDEYGVVYLGEEEVGIWKYGGEPEDGTAGRVLIDFSVIGNTLEIGSIEEGVEGLTLYPTSDGEGYLLAANEAASTVLVYERTGANELVGEFAIGEGDLDAVEELNGMDIVGLPLGDDFPEGLLVVQDDANDNDEANNFKLISWGDVAEALDLDVDTAYDVREGGLGGSVSEVAAVEPEVETDPVPSGTDAADDPAIWIHPEDTALSTIIGTDKTSGLVVYDLEGNTLQSIDVGRVNNVDLRYNFPLGDETVALVIASNRTDNTLILYAVDPETRELYEVGEPIESDVTEVYGFCMYYSMETGDYYAIVNSADTGEVEQWRLFDNGDGAVEGEMVRSFNVGSQTEGCAVDDEYGDLYIGEETVAIWKYGAEPGDGEEREEVDNTSEDGSITADIEGMAIYYASDGEGYLIVSSQGSSEFNVYTRDDNEFIGRFVIIEGEEADGVSGSDGLDVTNFPLGEEFDEGVFVTQDDLNINPEESQNFKLADWDDIAEELGLIIDTDFDPRLIGAE